MAIQETTDKEYCIQRCKNGWRVISWSPHYIMTEWVNTKKQAITDGDQAIDKYYATQRSLTCQP